MFDSIQKRLLICILSITTLLLLGIGILNYLWAEKVVVDLSEQRTAAKADAAAAKIEGYLLQKGQNAWTLAQNEQIHSFVGKVSSREVDLSQDKDYKEMMTSFQRIVTLNPDIKFVYVGVDKTDRLYGNTEFKYPKGYKVSERPWYQAAARERTLVFTGPYICPLTGNYVATASVPIYNNNGELLGVAAVDMPVSKIQQIVNEIHIGKSGYAFMLDDRGITITHPNTSYKGKPLLDVGSLDPKMADITGRMINGEKGIATIDVEKTPSYLLYMPISKIGWSIGVVVPVDEVREPIYTLGRISLLTVMIGMLIICLMIIALTSRIIRPINEFTKLMHQVAGGDYSVRAKVESRDEVGKLGNSLNHMLDKQEQLIRQVITMAYKMGLAGHELAITMGEARTTLPVVTGELSRLIDKPYLGAANNSDLFGQQDTREFMDKLITVNHINRSIAAAVERIEQAMNNISENSNWVDILYVVNQAKQDIDRVGEQLHSLCRLTEDLQMDFVDVTGAIENSSQNISDIVNTLQIVNSKITNISTIQSDSINRATETSKELVKWSQTLLQLTAYFHIKPYHEEDITVIRGGFEEENNIDTILQKGEKQ